MSPAELAAVVPEAPRAQCPLDRRLLRDERTACGGGGCLRTHFIVYPLGTRTGDKRR